MPPHLWTDEERVIMGLKCCGSDPLGRHICGLCPYRNYGKFCAGLLHYDALKLLEPKADEVDDGK